VTGPGRPGARPGAGRPCHDRAVDGYLIGPDGQSAPVTRAAVEQALSDDRLLWLDLHGVDDDTVTMLGEVFKLHPLALDDARDFGQRPKAENFGDILYLVCYAATKMLARLVEVHFFYGEQYLVTVHKAPCPPLEQVRKGLGTDGAPQPGDRRPVRGVLLYHLLDGMIDSFAPPLSDLDDQIDKLTEQIFNRPGQDVLAGLLGLQRWLVNVRKMAVPLRDMAASIMSGVVDLPGRTSDGDPYLRDLYDHVVRISDTIDSYRDLLSNSMDAYLSMVSNRLNEVMKQLTIIATVFLPLSFLTGFFGQNFGWLVSHLGSLPTFLLLGVGTEIAAVAGLYWLFKRRRWL
jgi:magnesium transporter